jgi:MFS family permease
MRFVIVFFTDLLRRISDRNIRTVYLTILLLGIAYGLALSVVGTYLGATFTEAQIGTLGSWFAAGIVLLAIPAGALIRRFGGKRVLVVALLGYAATAAVFPFAGTSYWVLGTIRLFDGAFSVAVWVSSETIILSRAPRADKAFFTSIYALSLALGYVIGPVIAYLTGPIIGEPGAFVGAGVIATVAALVVALRLQGGDAELHDDDAADAAADGASLAGSTLFSRIKTSCLATFSYGYFQASVVLFLPRYLIDDKGFSKNDTRLAPAFFALGMLLFANVAALVGDRVGHLAVMRVLGAIGTACIFGFVVVKSAAFLFVLVFVAGASLASISPVSLALQGIVTPHKELTRSGGMYNAAYALGMLVGPPISGALIGKIGGKAMNIHFAFIWIFFVLFTIAFRRDDPRVRKAVAQGGDGTFA